MVKLPLCQELIFVKYSDIIVSILIGNCVGREHNYTKESRTIMIKILIVDDSLFAQKVTGNTLKKSITNGEFYFASDGEEGLMRYQELNPDYVILDLLMPKMNGQTLIQKIKEYDEHANIFVLSADVQKTVRDEIDSYNILSFINKPITEEKAKMICDIIKGN